MRTMSRHSGLHAPSVTKAIRAQSVSWFHFSSFRRSFTRVPTKFIRLSAVLSCGVPRGIQSHPFCELADYGRRDAHVLLLLGSKIGYTTILYGPSGFSGP